MSQPPYLLYIAQATDPISAKTARGIAVWRPEWAVGQVRSPGSLIDLGVPDMGFAEAVAAGARTMVLGVANAGGVMAPSTVADVIAAMEAGLDVASGLHQRLADQPEIAARAGELGRSLWDVREPPKNLKVGTGERRAGKRLLTVGTDCSVGKMYTTLALEREMRARGLAADFRGTGQTGILIAGSGMPVDAVVADFISGSVEQLSPARDDGGWDLIEGQGSLFHPSYAGVSLGLLHGAQPDALVLCHEAGREIMRHMKTHPVPSLELCLDRNLEAARLTNPDVVAVGVALNTAGLDADAATDACAAVEERLGLPCQDPVRHGVSWIVDRLGQCFAL
ncbi:N-acetyltransferase DgcN [Sphingomonas sp. MS122]|uniref:N-acetyltransferase DgcN n=1 Tax=Sphingomonas sp. MS122 TaxID=3412683 RepID=UPI003C307F77